MNLNSWNNLATKLFEEVNYTQEIILYAEANDIIYDIETNNS